MTGAFLHHDHTIDFSIAFQYHPGAFRKPHITNNQNKDPYDGENYH